MSMNLATPTLSPARALLAAQGYALCIRGAGWVECLALREGERWMGTGPDEESALADVIARMLPSHLGRVLLEAHGAGVVPAGDELAPAEPLPSTSADPPTIPDPPRPEVAVAPEPSPAPPPASAEPAEAAPAAPRSPRAGTKQLYALLEAIEHDVPRVARMPADRQRLFMVRWICQARAVEETHHGDVGVDQAVTRVARRVAELAKTLWPGAVRVLHLGAQPGDVRAMLRAYAAPEPATWEAALAIATGVIEEQIAKAPGFGLDEDGWADAAVLVPSHPRPGEELARVVEVLAGVEAAGGGEAGGGEALDALAGAARTLRWLRRDVDAVAWGRAMGAVRRMLPQRMDLRDRRARLVRDALDPTFRPALPWASILAGDRT